MANRYVIGFACVVNVEPDSAAAEIKPLRQHIAALRRKLNGLVIAADPCDMADAVLTALEEVVAVAARAGPRPATGTAGAEPEAQGFRGPETAGGEEKNREECLRRRPTRPCECPLPRDAQTGRAR